MSVVLDPTGELTPAVRQLTPRPASLDGKTVGLLDLTKARMDCAILNEGPIQIYLQAGNTFSGNSPVKLPGGE